MTMENKHYRKVSVAIADLKVLEAMYGAMWMRYMADKEVPGVVFDAIFNINNSISNAVNLLQDVLKEGEDIFSDMKENA